MLSGRKIPTARKLHRKALLLMSRMSFLPFIQSCRKKTLFGGGLLVILSGGDPEDRREVLKELRNWIGWKVETTSHETVSHSTENHSTAIKRLRSDMERGAVCFVSCDKDSANAILPTIPAGWRRVVIVISNNGGDDLDADRQGYILNAKRCIWTEIATPNAT